MFFAGLYLFITFLQWQLDQTVEFMKRKPPVEDIWRKINCDDAASFLGLEDSVLLAKE
tara:strand:+ start:382 stop:555 length:174 start_codon:yes stop_codon:yes gene_type:complete